MQVPSLIVPVLSLGKTLFLSVQLLFFQSTPVEHGGRRRNKDELDELLVGADRLFLKPSLLPAISQGPQLPGFSSQVGLCWTAYSIFIYCHSCSEGPQTARRSLDGVWEMARKEESCLVLISGCLSPHTAEEVLAAFAVRQILLSPSCLSTYHSPRTFSTDWFTSDCNFVRSCCFPGARLPRAALCSLLQVID